VSNPVTICDVGPEEMLDLPRAADSPECQVTLDLSGPEQDPFEPMPPCMEFYKFHSDHLCSTTAHNGLWPLPLPNSVFLPPMFCPVPAAMNLGALLVEGEFEQRPTVWSWWRVDGKLQVYEVKGLPPRVVERLERPRKLSIQRCSQSLVHACQCRDANCNLQKCLKMKRVVAHTKQCKKKTNGGCPICKQLIALCCHHAMICQEAKCPIPFCLNIKQKLCEQQLQEKHQEADKSRRQLQHQQGPFKLRGKRPRRSNEL